MLKLKDITKIYKTGDNSVTALNKVNIEFRKSEFVSILGPSGCGKTTLLNIIGGLDQYSSGDLEINNKSTKKFKDADWDTYRNHKVGFVFQNYNLIPHQTVLENVELALTLSGIGKKERKRRAVAVLKKVGLKDKIKSKPNQLSGGQMQRVAIARALVNDPEIILADEPTGALDSVTSVQIMELLKDISKEKLIIMVTHNPELAEKYSTRIIKLLDGKLVDDSMPYSSKEEVIKEAKPAKTKKDKKRKMSFFTALSLSFKNLLTKKGRTILVSVAGSIGIIGIALILAISNGFSGYVNKTQQQTLSSYPLTLSNSSYEMSALLQIFLTDSEVVDHDKNKVYTKNELTEMLTKFNASSSKNDLASFKKYLDGDGKKEIEQYTSAIQYVYGVGINAFYNSTDNGIVSANETQVFSKVIENYGKEHITELTPGSDEAFRYGLLSQVFNAIFENEFWSEMLDNQELLKSQYELVGAGSEWAKEPNEVMIVVDKNNEITDYTLYALGLLNQEELENLLDAYVKGEEAKPIDATFTYEDLLGLEYKIIPEAFFFEKQPDGTYLDIRELDDNSSKIEALYNGDNAITIKVAGIIREREDASSLSIKTPVAYSSNLTKLIIEANKNSDVIKEQSLSDKNLLTGEAFDSESAPVEFQREAVLKTMGFVDIASPNEIKLYPVDFEAKEKISEFIGKYNDMCLEKGQSDKLITYSDTIGTMMSSISLIISSITYVLIAFVGVSLIVSSVMIGIITHISVIERTREIGVLRAVGASKKDVKRVFTAESFIIGLASGLIGIIVSLLLTIPINLILKKLTGIGAIASLPVVGAIVLVAISVGLTLIAGLIPAKMAAKKDPVIALRSE